MLHRQSQSCHTVDCHWDAYGHKDGLLTFSPVSELSVLQHTHHIKSLELSSCRPTKGSTSLAANVQGNRLETV